MTAALIDIEKEGVASAASARLSPGVKSKGKSPFKVLTTTDINQDLTSEESFTNAATKQGGRMPRPKPLNTANKKGLKGKGDIPQ